ncbi:MAG: hypothetical protein D3919_04960 [Candidatus Electrothrix sp. AW5]|nr:hypothetical protein [Candidatus Electrothrix gigas]
MNFISADQFQLFVTGTDDTGPVQAVEHDAPAEDCRIEAILKPDDTITLAIGPYIGDMGTPVVVPRNGRNIVLTGLAVDVTLNVADADAYTVLHNFLLARGRYVLEVCNMGQFGGV